MPDNDQRLKTLVKELLSEFFDAFLPEWGARLDFSHVTWLDKEIFPDPPDGPRRTLDLVAQLKVRQPLDGWPETTALIHIEAEANDPIAVFRRRMFVYATILMREYGLPVLPIALFLNTGLQGIGRDEYRVDFWELPVHRFQYLYIGLPALDAEAQLKTGNPMAVALSPLMNCPKQRRAWLKAEAWKLTRGLPLTDFARMLVTDCVDTYAKLDPAQVAEFNNLVEPEPPEVRPMGVIYETWERGKTEGRVEGRVEVLTDLLEGRFGALAPEVRLRLQQLSVEQLRDLGRRLLKAGSLKELGGFVGRIASEKSLPLGISA